MIPHPKKSYLPLWDLSLYLPINIDGADLQGRLWRELFRAANGLDHPTEGFLCDRWNPWNRQNLEVHRNNGIDIVPRMNENEHGSLMYHYLF